MSVDFIVSGNIGMRNISCVYLITDTWDDYSFRTLFKLVVFDSERNRHDIGSVKIGFKGQAIEQYKASKTVESIPKSFNNLDESYFSLGQDVKYYSNLNSLPPRLKELILKSLNDVAFDEELLPIIRTEAVFRTSLTRSVSISVIKGQYKRIIEGGSILTEFHFLYKKETTAKRAGFELDFHVDPNRSPSTNMHVLIGRNGIGKTTLLNNMVKAIIPPESDTEDYGVFLENYYMGSEIDEDYFSSVVSVSFSAFDPFIPPRERADRSKGTCFYYIGLKELYEDEEGKINYRLKEHAELSNDFVRSFKICLSMNSKKEQWLSGIEKLQSDMNFSEMNLPSLTEYSSHELESQADSLFRRMSSGHAIVLLTMTKLVETVEEKTLILLDEPECHLHPPLLSAFTRALSDLLHKRNAIAIIATHSPVVLQEVPKSCVWKLRRSGLEGISERPLNETFGENVGILTREVFGLEVSNSGFHELLSKAVSEGLSYDAILDSYNQQLGLEGKAILRSMITARDNS